MTIQVKTLFWRARGSYAVLLLYCNRVSDRVDRHFAPFVVTDTDVHQHTPAKISKADLNGLPTRQYLDQTVVPILLEALANLAKERPRDPIDHLINYLQKHKSEHAESQQQN